jgi:hypothetical protein
VLFTNNVTVGKSWVMRWDRHAGNIPEINAQACNIYSENVNIKDPVGDIVVDGRIILKCILEKYNVNVWIGFIWLRAWNIGGLL